MFSVVVSILALIASVVSVATCQFVKVKDGGPYLSLIAGWGGNSWDGSCSYDFWQYYSDGLEPDLEEDIALAAMAFGLIAACFGAILFSIVIASIFIFPKWMRFAVPSLAFVTTICQSMVFLLFASEPCTKDHADWNNDDWYNDDWHNDVYGKECYTSNGTFIYPNSYSRALDNTKSSKGLRGLQGVSVNFTSPTLSPTILPTSTPTYCYYLATVEPLSYAYSGTSGPGCSFSLGAVAALLAIALWFMCFVVMLFRRKSCNCNQCCCPDENNARSMNETLEQNNPADFQQIITEVNQSDGSKLTVTTFQPIFKEKITRTEVVHLDGSKSVKVTSERFETPLHDKK